MASAGKASEKNVAFSKGTIFAFFIIFLVYYGIFMENFVKEYSLPVYFSYIPLVCYIGALFAGIGLIIFIRNRTTQKSREIQSRKSVKMGSIYKQALLLVIFIFAFIPLFSPLIDQGKNHQYNSVYNNDWNGASEFKNILDESGYTVMTVQSSLSATDRLNKSILLILLGPNRFYNPLYEVPYFIDFFDNESRNSLLICHDHGSTSTLLWEIFIASAIDPDIQGSIPVTIFPDGVLRDNLSYDKRTDFPVITRFEPHETIVNVTQVILSQSSAALGGEFVTYFGWELIGKTSIYGFVDKNNDRKYDPDIDYYDTSFIAAMIPGFPTKYGLGGQEQSVFMAKDIGNGRIFLSADASLFNNELISIPDYDNSQFGINIINWLTYGGINKEDWVIVFDEAHIRPEITRDLSSAGIFGFIIQYIIHLSTNPITAWIYPLLAIYTLKKYLPKKDEKAEKKKAKEQEQKEERERFRTSSFFAEKIEWYRERSRYGKALTLLYRRLERKLNTLLRGNKISSKNVIEMVIAKEPNINKNKIKRITRFVDRILAIKEGKTKVKNEEDFENLFFEMEWVAKNI